jgi:hypothetical protein
MIECGTRIRGLVVGLALLCSPLTALAQANVGMGPLTGTLAETEPTTGALSIGRIRLAPGLVIREIGWDSNVFNTATDQKEDYVAAIAPDVSTFTLTRFLKLSAYAGGDFLYYQTYEAERHSGYAVRARADLLLSRVRPFVAGGRTNQRTRPNGEIDVRAIREDEEISGGLAFELSPTSIVYGAAYNLRNQYQNSFEEGVSLAESLNRTNREYSAGLRTELTPLLAVTLSGAYRIDGFDGAPIRDAASTSANVSLRIGAEAVLSGFINASYRDFKPQDPLLARYRGIAGTAGLVYPFLEFGRISLTAVRGTEYSFDETEGYFLENSLTLGYTHRLFGEVDAQVRGGRSLFDYGFRINSPAHRDQLDTVGGSLGYNLPNRTRVSLNYEYSRRRSVELPERNYARRRMYMAWTFAL